MMAINLDVKITDESNSEPLPTFWNYGHIHPVILARVPTVTVLRRPSTLSGFCRPALRRTGTVHNGGEEVYEIIEVNDIVAAGDPVSPPQYVDMDALAENQSQAPVDSSELHVEDGLPPGEPAAAITKRYVSLEQYLQLENQLELLTRNEAIVLQGRAELQSRIAQLEARNRAFTSSLQSITDSRGRALLEIADLKNQIRPSELRIQQARWETQSKARQCLSQEAQISNLQENIAHLKEKVSDLEEGKDRKESVIVALKDKVTAVQVENEQLRQEKSRTLAEKSSSRQNVSLITAERDHLLEQLSASKKEQEQLREEVRHLIVVRVEDRFQIDSVRRENTTLSQKVDEIQHAAVKEKTRFLKQLEKVETEQRQRETELLRQSARANGETSTSTLTSKADSKKLSELLSKIDILELDLESSRSETQNLREKLLQVESKWKELNRRVVIAEKSLEERDATIDFLSRNWEASKARLNEAVMQCDGLENTAYRAKLLSLEVTDLRDERTKLLQEAETLHQFSGDYRQRLAALEERLAKTDSELQKVELQHVTVLEEKEKACGLVKNLQNLQRLTSEDNNLLQNQIALMAGKLSVAELQLADVDNLRRDLSLAREQEAVWKQHALDWQGYSLQIAVKPSEGAVAVQTDGDYDELQVVQLESSLQSCQEEKDSAFRYLSESAAVARDLEESLANSQREQDSVKGALSAASEEISRLSKMNEQLTRKLTELQLTPGFKEGCNEKHLARAADIAHERDRSFEESSDEAAGPVSLQPCRTLSAQKVNIRERIAKLKRGEIRKQRGEKDSHELADVWYRSSPLERERHVKPGERDESNGHEVAYSENSHAKWENLVTLREDTADMKYEEVTKDNVDLQENDANLKVEPSYLDDQLRLLHEVDKDMKVKLGATEKKLDDLRQTRHVSPEDIADPLPIEDLEHPENVSPGHSSVSAKEENTETLAAGQKSNDQIAIEVAVLVDVQQRLRREVSEHDTYVSFLWSAVEPVLGKSRKTLESSNNKLLEDKQSLLAQTDPLNAREDEREMFDVSPCTVPAEAEPPFQTPKVDVKARIAKLRRRDPEMPADHGDAKHMKEWSSPKYFAETIPQELGDGISFLAAPDHRIPEKTVEEPNDGSPSQPEVECLIVAIQQLEEKNHDLEFQLASMNEQQSAAYQRIAELAAESQWLTAELTRRNSAEVNESAGVCATEENPSTLPEVLTDSNTLEASQSFIFEKNSAEYSDSTAGRTAGDIVKKVDIKQRLAKSKRAEFRRLLTVEESSEVTELRARCLSLEAQILKTMEDCRHKCEETAALSADKEAQWMQYIASQKEAADQDYGFLVTQYEVLERRYAGTNSQRPPNDRNFDELHMNYQWQHRGVPSIQGGNVVNDERSAVLKLDAGTAFERLSHGVNQREAWEGYPGERHDTHNELLVSSLVDYQTYSEPVRDHRDGSMQTHQHLPEAVKEYYGVELLYWVDQCRDLEEKLLDERLKDGRLGLTGVSKDPLWESFDMLGKKPAEESPELLQSNDISSQSINPIVTPWSAHFCQNCAENLETASMLRVEVAAASEKYHMAQKELERMEEKQGKGLAQLEITATRHEEEWKAYVKHLGELKETELREVSAELDDLKLQYTELEKLYMSTCQKPSDLDAGRLNLHDLSARDFSHQGEYDGGSFFTSSHLAHRSTFEHAKCDVGKSLSESEKIIAEKDELLSRIADLESHCTAANQKYTQATLEKEHLAALISQYSSYINQETGKEISTNTSADSSAVDGALNVPCQVCRKLERDLSELQAEYEQKSVLMAESAGVQENKWKLYVGNLRAEADAELEKVFANQASAFSWITELETMCVAANAEVSRLQSENERCLAQLSAASEKCLKVENMSNALTECEQKAAEISEAASRNQEEWKRYVELLQSTIEEKLDQVRAEKEQLSVELFAVMEKNWKLEEERRTNSYAEEAKVTAALTLQEIEKENEFLRAQTDELKVSFTFAMEDLSRLKTERETYLSELSAAKEKCSRLDEMVSKTTEQEERIAQMSSAVSQQDVQWKHYLESMQTVANEKLDHVTAQRDIFSAKLEDIVQNITVNQESLDEKYRAALVEAEKWRKIAEEVQATADMKLDDFSAKTIEMIARMADLEAVNVEATQTVARIGVERSKQAGELAAARQKGLQLDEVTRMMAANEEKLADVMEFAWKREAEWNQYVEKLQEVANIKLQDFQAEKDHVCAQLSEARSKCLEFEEAVRVLTETQQNIARESNTDPLVEEKWKQCTAQLQAAADLRFEEFSAEIIRLNTKISELETVHAAAQEKVVKLETAHAQCLDELAASRESYRTLEDDYVNLRNDGEKWRAEMIAASQQSQLEWEEFVKVQASLLEQKLAESLNELAAHRRQLSETVEENVQISTLMKEATVETHLGQEEGDAALVESDEIYMFVSKEQRPNLTPRGRPSAEALHHLWTPDATLPIGATIGSVETAAANYESTCSAACDLYDAQSVASDVSQARHATDVARLRSTNRELLEEIAVLSESNLALEAENLRLLTACAKKVEDPASNLPDIAVPGFRREREFMEIREVPPLKVHSAGQTASHRLHIQFDQKPSIFDEIVQNQPVVFASKFPGTSAADTLWDPDVQPVNFGAEIEIGPGNTVLDKSKLQEARSAQPAEIPQAPFKSRDPPLPSTEVDSLRTQIDDFRAENERLRLEVFSLFDELVRMQTSATENTDLRTTIRGDIEIMEPLHSSSFLGEQVSAKVEPAEATVVIAQFEHRILELEAQLQASHSELYLSKALVVELEQEKAQYEIQMTQCQSARENQMREYANLLQQEKGGLMERIATLSGDLEVLKQTQVIVRESALFEVPPSSGLQTPALSGRTPVNIDAADMWSTFSEAAQHNAVGEDFGGTAPDGDWSAGRDSAYNGDSFNTVDLPPLRPVDILEFTVRELAKTPAISCTMCERLSMTLETTAHQIASLNEEIEMLGANRNSIGLSQRAVDPTSAMEKLRASIAELSWQNKERRERLEHKEMVFASDAAAVENDREASAPEAEEIVRLMEDRAKLQLEIFRLQQEVGFLRANMRKQGNDWSGEAENQTVKSDKLMDAYYDASVEGSNAVEDFDCLGELATRIQQKISDSYPHLAQNTRSPVFNNNLSGSQSCFPLTTLQQNVSLLLCCLELAENERDELRAISVLSLNTGKQLHGSVNQTDRDLSLAKLEPSETAVRLREETPEIEIVALQMELQDARNGTVDSVSSLTTTCLRLQRELLSVRDELCNAKKEAEKWRSTNEDLTLRYEDKLLKHQTCQSTCDKLLSQIAGLEEVIADKDAALVSALANAGDELVQFKASVELENQGLLVQLELLEVDLLRKNEELVTSQDTVSDLLRQKAATEKQLVDAPKRMEKERKKLAEARDKLVLAHQELHGTRKQLVEMADSQKNSVEENAKLKEDHDNLRRHKDNLEKEVLALKAEVERRQMLHDTFRDRVVHEASVLDTEIQELRDHLQTRELEFNSLEMVVEDLRGENMNLLNRLKAARRGYRNSSHSRNSGESDRSARVSIDARDILGNGPANQKFPSLAESQESLKPPSALKSCMRSLKSEIDDLKAQMDLHLQVVKSKSDLF